MLCSKPFEEAPDDERAPRCVVETGCLNTRAGIRPALDIDIKRDLDKRHDLAASRSSNRDASEPIAAPGGLRRVTACRRPGRRTSREQPI